MLWSKDIQTNLNELAENGKIPDILVRTGIRSKCRKLIENLNEGNCEQKMERMNKWLSAMQNSPIAIHTDKSKEQHYEVPAQFFEVVLGTRRKYSCCYYPKGTETIDQAEEASLLETVNRAAIADGMKILELGCGWGSLTLFMAEKFPNANITAVSHSNSQRETIQKLAQQKGFENVRVITMDMNDFAPDEPGTFDRVVSIEMFEHMRNHSLLMERISKWLKPTGKLFVHVFCHKEFSYPYVSEGPRDWMTNHFFTGGMMPSDSLFHYYQEHLRLEGRWRWSGQHYEKTLNQWLIKMDTAKEQLFPLFIDVYGQEASVWWQRWRMFFMACAEFFGLNKGDEWWVAHYLFANKRQDS